MALLSKMRKGFNAHIRISDIAWLAGILDGEGCLIFNPQHKPNRHLLRLQFTNTDEGILVEIKRILAEWLVPYSFHPSTKNHLGKKPCWNIEVYRRMEISFILEKLIPYLKSVKKAKAFLILDYIKQTYRCSNGHLNPRRRKLAQLELKF